MLGIKKLIIGVVIGAIVGFWIGINMGKGQPLFANPFADKEVRQMTKEKAAEIVDETKETIKKKLEQ